MVEKLVNFCRNKFDINNARYTEPYHSLSVCILDCVYSLRAKYYPVTVPIIKRYANLFMNGDIQATGYTTHDLINHID